MGQSPGIRLRRRIVSIFFATIILLAALLGRVAFIQFVRGEQLSAAAENERMREIRVEAKRGAIYDRRGRELAVSFNAETIYAVPFEITDPDMTARKLSEILGLDYENLLARLTKASAFEYVKRKVEPDIAQKVRELNLPGIGLTQESKRYYPKGNLASHVLGISGIDSQGLEGVEYYYDRELKGTEGKIIVEFDARGRELPQARHRYVPAQDGLSLYLTIDETLQFIAERELEKAMAENGAKKGVIILMDPKTGEILALANRPDFDPNHYGDYEPSARRNTAISDAYHPGSTFKPITAAAALEQGTASVNSTYFCDGATTISGFTIGCTSAHGSLTLLQAIEKSCNSSLVQIGLDLGITNFYRFARDFGLMSKTGIDLPGEAVGQLPREESAKQIDLAVMSFGQTLSVTPLRLLTSISAIANDGVMMRPHVAKEFVDQSGKVVRRIEPEAVMQVVSKATADEIIRGMQAVVETGTGRRAQIPGYTVAGKTGTAEKKQGVDGLWLGWFVGFAPVEDPRLAAVVMFDEPVSSHYGGVVSAPVFAAVVRDALRYLEIAPSRREEESEEERVEVPDITGLTTEEAGEILQQKGLNLQYNGYGGEIGQQVPPAGTQVEAGTRVLGIERQESGELVKVPNLIGLTMRQAGTLLGEGGLLMEPSGSGLAVDQFPQPGLSVPPGTVVQVEFQQPRRSD